MKGHEVRATIIVAIIAVAGLQAGCGTCHDKTCTTTKEAVCPQGSIESGENCYIEPSCPPDTEPVLTESGLRCFLTGECPPDAPFDVESARCYYPGECPSDTVSQQGACYFSPECPAPWLKVGGKCTYPTCQPNSQAFQCACAESAIVKESNGKQYCCAPLVRGIVGCPICPQGQVVNPCTDKCEVPK